MSVNCDNSQNRKKLHWELELKAKRAPLIFQVTKKYCCHFANKIESQLKKTEGRLFQDHVKTTFVKTSLICFDPIRSNLIQFDPIWFIWIHFDPIWANVIKFDPTCNKLVTFYMIIPEQQQLSNSRTLAVNANY